MCRVSIRELGTGEGCVLDTVFAGLSGQSRYLRFHSPVSRMTAQTRRVLTDVDGHRHIAFVATADLEPIGIARAIAYGDGRADLAIEVIDAWHGHGVGTRLLRALRERAVTAGHTALVADVLAENRAVVALLCKVFPVHTVVRDGAELTLTLPLSDSWSFDASHLLSA